MELVEKTDTQRSIYHANKHRNLCKPPYINVQLTQTHKYTENDLIDESGKINKLRSMRKKVTHFLLLDELISYRLSRKPTLLKLKGRYFAFGRCQRHPAKWRSIKLWHNSHNNGFIDTMLVEGRRKDNPVPVDNTNANDCSGWRLSGAKGRGKSLYVYIRGPCV